MITNVELGSKRLEDYELRTLELELRTGGNINVRDMLRVVIEVQKLRELESEAIAELNEEVEYLKNELADVRFDAQLTKAAG